MAKPVIPEWLAKEIAMRNPEDVLPYIVDELIGATVERDQLAAAQKENKRLLREAVQKLQATQRPAARIVNGIISAVRSAELGRIYSDCQMSGVQARQALADPAPACTECGGRRYIAGHGPDGEPNGEPCPKCNPPLGAPNKN